MRHIAIIAIGIAAGALAAPAGAGPELKPPGVEVEAPAAIVAEPGPPVRDVRRMPGQILRCWQGGRLLYEAGGFRSLPDRASGAVVVPRNGEAAPVTVIDMKDGMCILSTE